MITSTAALHAQAPACRSSALGVTLGQSNGAAGTIYYPIVFTNHGSSACSLRGYPGVSSVGAAGHQIGEPAPWQAAGKRVVTVVLRPGGAASALYGQVQALNFPKARCHPQNALGLRVYPPNLTAARYLPLKHLACSTTIGDSHVAPVQPGRAG